MSNLTDAYEAAEARKEAALGADSMVSMPGDLQRRAVFLGFDIDHDELTEVVERVGYFFARLSASTDFIPLNKVMGSAWVDGFLIGLLLGKSTDKPTQDDATS